MPTWQYFPGPEYFQNRLPCDSTATSRFRRLLGENRAEELLAQMVTIAVGLNLNERQELTMAHPTDNGLLEAARRKLLNAAKTKGIRIGYAWSESRDIGV